MSFEYAGNPKKMLAGYLNKADLGEVTGEGIRQGAMSEASAYVRNLAAEDPMEALAAKEIAADQKRQLNEELAGMEMDVDQFGTILNAGTTMAAGAMKGSDFSLFGDKGGNDEIPLGLGDGTDKAALTPGIDLRSDRDIFLNPVAGYGSDRYGNVMNG